MTFLYDITFILIIAVPPIFTSRIECSHLEVLHPPATLLPYPLKGLRPEALRPILSNGLPFSNVFI
jgi:hypothetical protein